MMQSSADVPITTAPPPPPVEEKPKLQPPHPQMKASSSSKQQQPTASTTMADSNLTATVAAVAAAAAQNQTATLPQYHITPAIQGATKYAQLLALIDELGKDIRPSYTGNRNSMERLKRGIVHARVLARECVLEVEKAARQPASSSSSSS